MGKESQFEKPGEQRGKFKYKIILQDYQLNKQTVVVTEEHLMKVIIEEKIVGQEKRTNSRMNSSR